MADTTALALRSLNVVLTELLDGPSPDAAYVLNGGDRGLLASLDLLTAAAASTRTDGRASIASHVDHLRYGFQLLNRWARGEDPWRDADWAASWQRQHVNDGEWRALRDGLAREAAAWRETVASPRVWDAAGTTNAVAIVVHLAYHLGAIRQIDRTLSGPPAAQ